jgi:putative PIN family toxin of toxin-antitoxin system
MSARKHRLPVVLDTNIFVRNFKSRRKSSPNRTIIRLWLLERKLQLIVSQEVIAEYLEIFDRVLRMGQAALDKWEKRFADGPGVTFVNLGRRDFESRDPDDNVFLSTARAGKAEYLVTNDRDLLDLPEASQRALPFSIVKPDDFLTLVEGRK